MAYAISDAYYKFLAKIESSGKALAVAGKANNSDPNANADYRNPVGSSSASGLYQFVYSTWTSLGYAWKDRFNVDLQNEAIRKFTTDNANILDKAGIAINEATLYAAHFLGATGATRILSKSDDTPIDKAASAGQISANPFLKGMTVGDFKNWLTKKTGASINGPQ